MASNGYYATNSAYFGAQPTSSVNQYGQQVITYHQAMPTTQPQQQQAVAAYNPKTATTYYTTTTYGATPPGGAGGGGTFIAPGYATTGGGAGATTAPIFGAAGGGQQTVHVVQQQSGTVVGAPPLPPQPQPQTAHIMQQLGGHSQGAPIASQAWAQAAAQQQQHPSVTYNANNYGGANRGGGANTAYGGYAAHSANTMGLSSNNPPLPSSTRPLSYATHQQANVQTGGAAGTGFPHNRNFNGSNFQHRNGKSSGGGGGAYTSIIHQHFVSANANVSNQESSAGSANNISQYNKHFPSDMRGPSSGVWNSQKRNFRKQYAKPKEAQAVYYCDLCKISCGGADSYKAHMTGSKHKKKETLVKLQESMMQKGGGAAADSKESANRQSALENMGRLTMYKCEVCSSSCSSRMAYDTHLKGAKHARTEKLLTQMGKPLPSSEPVILSSGEPSKRRIMLNKGGNKAPPPTETIKVLIGGQPDQPQLTDETGAVVSPVGEDYVTEVLSKTTGNFESFHCSLCECNFTDIQAKSGHCRGRRHRLSYKKKVDPSLVVDLKPNVLANRLKQRELKLDWKRKSMEDSSSSNFVPPAVAPSPFFQSPPMLMRGGPPIGMRSPFAAQSPGAFGVLVTPPYHHQPHMSVDDKLVLRKHTQIAAPAHLVEFVNACITKIELNLKIISKEIKIASSSSVVTPETADESPTGAGDQFLKGLVKIGSFGKGVFLEDDLVVELALLCSIIPNVGIVDQVIGKLKKKLMEEETDDDDVEDSITIDSVEGVVVESAAGEERKVFGKNIVITCSTSSSEDGSTVFGACLDKQIHVVLFCTAPQAEKAVESSKSSVCSMENSFSLSYCQRVLSGVRQTKWFMNMIGMNVTCVSITRIIRHLLLYTDLESIEEFNELRDKVGLQTSVFGSTATNSAPHDNDFILELFVAKVLVESYMGAHMLPPLSPSKALLRVFEALSSGILLSRMSGQSLKMLIDPTKPEQTLSFSEHVTKQHMCDLTTFAQICVRMISCKRVVNILGDLADEEEEMGGYGHLAGHKTVKDDDMSKKEETARLEEDTTDSSSPSKMAKTSET